MSEDRLDRIEKIIESNARAIEALANSVANDREQWKQQQRGPYEYLARIARLAHRQVSTRNRQVSIGI
jgi:hypothetical protein